MRLIAITGGIGSGKSVVARMVQVMGYQVYDCDSRAKALMTEDDDVRRQLVEAFGAETFLADGTLNRQHLSAVAFGNNESLSRLNGIVHPATANDMQQWGRKLADGGAQVHCCEPPGWTGSWTRCGMLLLLPACAFRVSWHAAA